jgi:hypothetical protein
VPGECHNGMKMLIKVFCDTGAVTTSKLKLGSGVARAANRSVLAPSNHTAIGRLRSGAAGRGGAGAAAAALAAGAVAVAAGLLL